VNSNITVHSCTYQHVSTVINNHYYCVDAIIHAICIVSICM